MFISDPDRIRIRPKVSDPYGSGSATLDYGVGAIRTRFQTSNTYPSTLSSYFSGHGALRLYTSNGLHHQDVLGVSKNRRQSARPVQVRMTAIGGGGVCFMPLMSVAHVNHQTQFNGNVWKGFQRFWWHAATFKKFILH
jgi:hypothetical protein